MLQLPQAMGKGVARCLVFTPPWRQLVLLPLSRGCVGMSLNVFLNPPRSSSRELRMRVPFFVVYFSRGTLPKKRVSKGTTGEPSRSRVSPFAPRGHQLCVNPCAVPIFPPKLGCTGRSRPKTAVPSLQPSGKSTIGRSGRLPFPNFWGSSQNVHFHDSWKEGVYLLSEPASKKMEFRSANHVQNTKA